MRKPDADLVTIKIPIPKTFAQESKYQDVKKKTIRKSVFNTEPAASSVKYPIPDNSLFQGKAYGEDLLLPYRLYEKNLGKIVRKQRLAIDLEKKYEIMYTEMQKRLHIDEPPDDVKAVTDIDARFFKYFDIHARTEYVLLYKSLAFIYHRQLRTKQEIGYRRDGILNIETTYRKELQIYQTGVGKYMEQVKLFDNFISEDYEKSIECLRKAETLYVSKIDTTVSELQYLASTQFLTQSKLLGIDYLYYTLQKYGRFLYYLSPPSWRANHKDFAHSVEIEAKGFDLGTSSEEDTFQVIFEKMQNDCVSGLIKPVLYFSHPSDLMTIFETLEKQQLHHFTHVARLQPVTDMLKKTIAYLRISIQNDTNFVADIIEDFEKLIDFDEERAKQLENKFMKILHGLFYDRVAGIDVLKLQMNLEWCYERIFMEKSSSTILATAKALEDMYMEYSYKLDAVSNDEIKACLIQSTAEEQTRMKKAKMAARELRLFTRLEKSLLGAYVNKNTVVEARAADVKKPSTRKLNGPAIKPIDRRSSQRALTDAEIEYLCLFTEWTEKENPAKYLQSF